MKKIKKTLLVLLTFVLTVGGVISASAATTSVNMSASKSKAKVLTKTGTYKLNNRGNYDYGFVKFKAPKTGTYTFTFNDLRYKGDTKDMKSEEYMGEYSSSKYDRDVTIELQTGSDKSGWGGIDFGNGNSRFNLVNLHNVIYDTYLFGDFDSLEDAATAITDGDVTEDDILEYLKGGAPEIKLTLTMKKGTVIRMWIQDDEGKTYCTMKIKKVNKK